jgi:sarcosine oxidase subunit alpha
MTGAFRTTSGGRIDRTQPVNFTFDGKPMTGAAGDTLASALLANGQHLVARSFKYHRPRGILTCGAEEPNALVTVSRDTARTTPNLRATQVDLCAGLAASSQNRWPSLTFDAGAVNDLLAPLFPSGFYYKTFLWPASFWKSVYEPRIRAAAGLGVSPTQPDPDRYETLNAHAEVLVVGAGPAGLAAALAAAETGARVILCDEQQEFGGSLLSETIASIDGRPALAWIADAVATLAANPRVTLLPRTTAFGIFAGNHVALAERVTDHLAAPDPKLPRERLWQVRAKAVVLATGALERPLVFPENDRPGILTAGAGYTYLERYGVKPGNRVLLTGTHDTIYRAALALHRYGVAVAAIADRRANPDGPLALEARAAGLRIETGTVVTGTRGRLRVHHATTGRVVGDDVKGGDVIACDAILMSAGWTPNVSLFSQARGQLRFDADRQFYLPGTIDADIRCAGACSGTGDLAAVIAEGFAQGSAAAGRPAHRTAHVTNTLPSTGGSLGLEPNDRNPRRAKAFVDFQHDVTAKDIKLAAQEGFRSIEHVKRYTTTGMATDQGKTSNMHALGIVSTVLDRPIPQIGLTTFRMPYTPTTFGLFAGTSRGDLFDPVRRTPVDGWAQAKGAMFEDVGLWKRARFFPRPGEDMHRAVARECRTVREAAGLFDASTLGKIEVVGPDAAEFLNRLYVNPWTKLEPGRCRYGILLNEAGFIIDDGVVGRLAPDRFHVTTTTGGAARVLHMMEDYLQTEWPDLNVWLTSTTEQWAVIAVQGPKAREILAPLVDGMDLSKDAFPHMAVKEGTFQGVSMRLFRVSFTGEAGFEVNVPAAYGRAAWEAIWARAEPLGACAYGTETMHVLRAEKGFIIVGQETDGTVVPDDVGLAWAIGKAKPDFVGKRSLARPDIVAAGRKQLVGLRTVDPRIVLEEGAQIVAVADPPKGTPALGHVTSAYHSAFLGRSIALALVADGRARTGQRLFVPMPGGSIAVEVVDPVFVDRAGSRIDG